MARNDILTYYAHSGEREWQRLARTNDGAIEFAVTCHTLAQHLPPSARILDIGGGPGRYTIWLAQQGHRVVLADLSPALLSIARAQIEQAGIGENIEAVLEADACNLSMWEDNTFDAVLCLGPFYHLPDPADRIQAADELVRVLRPGGMAFVAFMPRYALLLRTLSLPDERHRLASRQWVSQLLETGAFHNDVPGRFTGGYGARPEEIQPFFAERGLSSVELLAAEGFVTGIQTTVAELAGTDPDLYQAVLELILETARDPALHGTCGHLLYVGRKL